MSLWKCRNNGKLLKMGIILWVSLFLLTSLSSQVNTSDQKPIANEAQLKEKANQVKELMTNVTEDRIKTLFSQSFLEMAPLPVTKDFLITLNQQLEGVRRVWLVHLVDAYECILEIVGKNGIRVRGSMRIDPEQPGKLMHLRFSPNLPKESRDHWLTEFKSLPDNVACDISRVDIVPRMLIEHAPNQSMAIGSSMKLFVLATLAETIRKGEMRWTDIIKLENRWKSLPSGILQDWPDGSPVTLHTLAGLMISRSDNTAADHLIHHLGPDRIRNLQLKFDRDGRNQPFLKTSELFRLKLKADDLLLSKWLKAGKEEREKLLPEVHSLSLKYPAIPTTPRLIDKVEWFYSPRELSFLLALLKEEYPETLPFLALAKPFPFDPEMWNYVGFKGGAEEGVHNITILAQTKHKPAWYTLTMTANNPNKSIDQRRWIDFAERAMYLLEGEHEK